MKKAFYYILIVIFSMIFVYKCVAFVICLTNGSILMALWQALMTFFSFAVVRDIAEKI